MPAEYTQDQLWKLYENLPPDLQEAIFSEKNAEHIDAICGRYKLAEEKIPEIAGLVGKILLGIMPPENFQDVLEKEAGLKREIAKEVAHEINRFILAPVKGSLDQIYHIGTTPPEKPQAPPKETPTSTPAEEEPKPETQRTFDIYREQIE